MKRIFWGLLVGLFLLPVSAARADTGLVPPLHGGLTGNPKAAQEINDLLDRAMILYDLDPTAATRVQAKKILGKLYDQFGIRITDILDEMIRAHVPGLDINFEEAATMSASFLAGEKAVK